MAEELINFIKTYLAKGHSKEAIESALLKNGWDKSSISLAFAQAGLTFSQESALTFHGRPMPKWVDFLILISISAIHFFLDKEIGSTLKIVYRVLSQCQQGLMGGCKYFFAFVLIANSIIYLVIPGLFLVAILRKNSKIVLISLLLLGLLHVWIILSIFRTSALEFSKSVPGLYYLSPLVMFLALSITLFTSKLLKISDFLKGVILRAETVIFLVMLILISTFLHSNSRLNVAFELLNPKPFNLIEVAKDANEQRIEKKANENNSQLAMCTRDPEHVLFPDSLKMKDKEYPKKLFDYSENGEQIPISDKSEVREFGDVNDLMHLSVIRKNKNPESFNVQGLIFDSSKKGMKKLYGEKVAFSIDPTNKQWSILASVPDLVFISFQPIHWADSEIQIDTLETLFKDWFTKVCSAY